MILYKRGIKYWNFEDDGVFYTPSKFTINTISNDFYIVYENNLKSKKYNISEVTLTDLEAGGSFTFANIDLFMQKLEELNCPCFQKDVTNINNPPFDPATTDLDVFLNNSADPYIRVSELDAVPTNGSNNAVSSNGVFDALVGKLSNVLTDYSDATLPIADNTPLLVNQGGIWKKVNKNDLIKERYSFVGRFSMTFPANLNYVRIAQGAYTWSDAGTSNANLISLTDTNHLLKLPISANLIKLTLFSWNDTSIAIYKSDLLATSVVNGVLIYQNDFTLQGINNLNIPVTIEKDKVIHVFFRRRNFTAAYNTTFYIDFLNS